ncbi:gametocyte-specific factor 1 [Echeneis naucrates]|uniref:gametocyte-specific factor 1 n=1 Tax=Echeneis naucrates TaxID=173247 RepID=UPI0011135263|nr:gametocyte-specific factor 1-like [Echeneis naucrates]
MTPAQRESRVSMSYRNDAGTRESRVSMSYRNDAGTRESRVSMSYRNDAGTTGKQSLATKSSREMTTIRFGSSSGPCRTSAGRDEHSEGIDDKGNYDQDKILQCPFDKNHKMRASRFPYHLIKCRKNHPKLASELKPCPFNARHLVPGHEMTHHIETCQNRISVESEECTNMNGHWKSQVPNNAWVKPNMTEDWDKECDDNAPPFVWGENTSSNQLLYTQATNMLGRSFRVPKDLPWSSMNP